MTVNSCASFSNLIDEEPEEGACQRGTRGSGRLWHCPALLCVSPRPGRQEHRATCTGHAPRDGALYSGVPQGMAFLAT